MGLNLLFLAAGASLYPLTIVRLSVHENYKYFDYVSISNYVDGIMNPLRMRSWNSTHLSIRMKISA